MDEHSVVFLSLMFFDWWWATEFSPNLYTASVSEGWMQWGMMVFHQVSVGVLLYALFALCSLHWDSAFGVGASQNASLIIDASGNSSRSIPDTLFGIFFEVNNLLFLARFLLSFATSSFSLIALYTAVLWDVPGHVEGASNQFKQFIRSLHLLDTM